MYQFKAVIVGMLALVLAACNPVENLEQSDAAIAQFETQYSAGNLDRMWGMTGEELREVTTREEFDDLYQFINMRLGKIVSSERSGFNLNTNNGVTRTVITMRTEFENGSGIQTYTFHGNGEEMTIVGWFVDSPELAISPSDLPTE